MASQIIGPVRPGAPTAYDSTKTYTPPNRVVIAGVVWECVKKTAIGESPITTPEKWIVVSPGFDKQQYEAALASIEEAQQAADDAALLAEGALPKSGGTMTGQLSIHKDVQAKLFLYDMRMERAVDPSVDLYNSVDFLDKNGGALGMVENWQTPNGTSCMSLMARNITSSGQFVLQRLGAAILRDGTAYSYGPPPRANNYGNDLVTTKWALDNFRRFTPSGNLYVDPANGSDTVDLYAGRGWSKDKPFASLNAALNVLGHFVSSNEIAINLMSNMEWTASLHWFKFPSINSLIIRSDPDGPKRTLNVPAQIAHYCSMVGLDNIIINFTNSSSGGFDVNGAYRGSSPTLLLRAGVELRGAAPTVIGARNNAFVNVASGVSGTITGRKYAASGGSTIVGAANIPGTTAGTVDASSHAI